MNIEEAREISLSLKCVTEDTPFGPDTLVFRVMNKIFCFVSLDTEEDRISLKCDPNYAVELREKHSDIIPGYHLNKQHWNTIYIQKTPDNLTKELIKHSYDLIVSSLPKKLKTELALKQSLL